MSAARNGRRAKSGKTPTTFVPRVGPSTQHKRRRTSLLKRSLIDLHDHLYEKLEKLGIETRYEFRKKDPIVTTILAVEHRIKWRERK